MSDQNLNNLRSEDDKVTLVWAQRRAVYAAAKAEHPERWSQTTHAASDLCRMYPMHCQSTPVLSPPQLAVRPGCSFTVHGDFVGLRCATGQKYRGIRRHVWPEVMKITANNPLRDEQLGMTVNLRGCHLPRAPRCLGKQPG